MNSVGKLCASLGVISLLLHSHGASATTYNVNVQLTELNQQDFIFPGSITGSITIVNSAITDYSLNIHFSTGAELLLTMNNSFFQGGPFQTTLTTLNGPPSGSGVSFIQPAGPGLASGIDFGSTSIDAGIASVPIGGISNGLPLSYLVGTVTPIPAAFPLFATGLGVMGLIARRRNRRGDAPHS
jgi:hypothetical protein